MGPPPEETIREIEARGRQIATYLLAAAAGTERLRGQSAAIPASTVVLQGRDGGWEVLFLSEPDPVGKGTAVIAQVGFDPTSGQAAEVRLMAPPRPAPAATVSYARAIETARAAAAGRPGAPAPHEAAVFRERDGTFSVYLKSTGGEPGVPRFGADLLARVAASGRQILSVEALHSGESLPPPASRAPGQASLHTHGLGDLPTPTDVAVVMRHPELAPHLVLTPRSMFRIDARGGITYLGPNPAPPPTAGGGR